MKHECHPEEIFVFGSNLAGIHGKGAARTAQLYWGARYRVGVGFHGQSYAIPTKDRGLSPLPLDEIKRYVDDLISLAIREEGLQFFVTRIGCGLAGYTDHQIAPMFARAPRNVRLPPGWRTI